MNFDNPNDLGLLQFGLGLLQASGPRPYRQTFGAGLAEGAQQGIAARQRQQVMLDEMKQREMRRKVMELEFSKFMNELEREKKIEEAAKASTLDRTQMALQAGGGPTPEAAQALEQLPTGTSSFDQEGFINRLRGISPLVALKYQQEQRAANRPIVTPGGDVLDPTGTRVIYQKPLQDKAQTPTNEERLVDAAVRHLPEPQRSEARQKMLLDIAQRKGEPSLQLVTTTEGIIGVGRRGERTPIGRPQTTPLPAAAVNDLTSKKQEADNITRVLDSFKDEYGGSISDVVGSTYNWASRNLPGVDAARGQWWQDMAAIENIERNRIFGGALTPTEAAEWYKTSVTPAMKPEIIRSNLKRRKKVIENALNRSAKTWSSGGRYSADQIYEATGVQVEPQRNGGMATDTSLPTMDEIDAELEKRMNQPR